MATNEEVKADIVELLYATFSRVKDRPVAEFLPMVDGLILLPADYTPPLKFWECGYAMSYHACFGRISLLLKTAISFDSELCCLRFDETIAKEKLRQELLVTAGNKRGAELLCDALAGKEGDIFLCLMLLWEIGEKRFVGAAMMEDTMLLNMARGCDIARRKKKKLSAN